MSPFYERLPNVPGSAPTRPPRRSDSRWSAAVAALMAAHGVGKDVQAVQARDRASARRGPATPVDGAHRPRLPTDRHDAGATDPPAGAGRPPQPSSDPPVQPGSGGN